ncbi:MAG: hypothetical protein IPN13_02800 [Bacteroidetes bacterium]|nr:hypothetical protein [Bacteroidota bacterium]
MKKIYLIALFTVFCIGTQAQSLTATNVYISGDPTFFYGRARYNHQY